MKTLFLSILALASTLMAWSQRFDDEFDNRTLRIDYTFAGNVNKQDISVAKLNVMPGWFGKRQRLAEVPVEGNGQITVRRKKDKQVIYRNSFCTLFQEWLTYDEAKTSSKSFENVFLVPMPKDTVEITVDLRNNRREVVASLTHTVAPKDILIRKVGQSAVTPYEVLQKAADPNRCIHISYVAEGYTEAEMDVFLKDAKEATEALFAHEPFKSTRERFNIVAVKSPSKESGTSVPSKGIWKNTALHSHFDTFYSDRYLTTLHLKDLHDWLAGTPYEHIIVLVNTEKYGGGGILNSYNLSMVRNSYFKPVVVHEFGHSFAGLGDEYAYEKEQINMYPTDVEPWEPNLTTLVDFHGKWEKLIDKKTPIPTPQPADLDKANVRRDKWKVGVYEPAGYSQHGVYRAYPDCRMRTNMHPEFCPACNLGLTKLIKFYTGE